MVAKVTACEDNVSKILSTISHPLRREILRFINEKDECSFTELLTMLEVDTGKLSFHLRTLSPFLEQTSSGKYKLSKTGENAFHVIQDIEHWAEGANVASRTAQLSYASFVQRSEAYVVDGLLMLGVTLIFAISEIFPSLIGFPTPFNLGIVPFVALGLLFVYSTLMEGFSGQTLGKRLVGLKVVRVDGKKLDYEHSAVRNFGKTFLLPLDLLLGLKHESYIRYFDKFAGTTVIDVRAPPKPLPEATDACKKDLELESGSPETGEASV